MLAFRVDNPFWMRKTRKETWYGKHKLTRRDDRTQVSHSSAREPRSSAGARRRIVAAGLISRFRLHFFARALLITCFTRARIRYDDKPSRRRAEILCNHIADALRRLHSDAIDAHLPRPQLVELEPLLPCALRVALHGVPRCRPLVFQQHRLALRRHVGRRVARKLTCARRRAPVPSCRVDQAVKLVHHGDAAPSVLAF